MYPLPTMMPATGLGLGWSIIAIATIVTIVGALVRLVPTYRFQRMIGSAWTRVTGAFRSKPVTR